MKRAAIASPTKRDANDRDLTDAALAIRRAFDSARRQLQDRSRRVRGQVKRHRMQ
jgi:hypothetical protein